MMIMGTGLYTTYRDSIEHFIRLPLFYSMMVKMVYCYHFERFE